MEIRDRVRRHFGLLLLAMFAVALLIKLGYWQLARAQEKHDRTSLYEKRMTAEPVNLDNLIEAPLSDVAWRRVSALGQFGQVHVLLDNRTVNGRVGFEVLSSLELTSGKHLLVNRGWITAGATRATIPEFTTPVASVEIHGHLGPPPVTGLKFGDDADRIEALNDKLILVQHVDLATIGQRFDADLGSFVFYLDNRAPAGFQRSWIRPGDGSAKHRAYAVQWFAMAAVLTIITLLLLFRRNAGQLS